MSALGPLRLLTQLCRPHACIPRTLPTLRLVPIARYGSAPTHVTHKLRSSEISTTALTGKKRTIKRKTSKLEHPNVLAYATCEEYDLTSLRKGLTEQGLYEVIPLPEETTAIHARAKYLANGNPRDIFFFEEGSVVFWNCGETEANSVLKFLRPFEERAYRRDMVEDELELMEFKLHNGQRTRVVDGVIELRRVDTDLEEHTVQQHKTNTGEKIKPNSASGVTKSTSAGADPLEMYAFSNGVALSVKLAIWEAILEEYVDSIESILKEIEDGRKLTVSRHQVFRKTGELFSLRHRLNLSSDLLDIPDFYWDREDLETHFLKTVKMYAIDRRTRVMNEKIKHCQELMDLVSHHLEDKHHVRLELMIIILIVVEVIFEFVHYAERFSHSDEVVQQSA